MPVDMTALAADLAAESAVTRALVAGLDEAGWHTPTPAAGWDIADQISHLAYFDEVTVRSALHPAEFEAELAAAREGVNPDAIAARFRDRSGAQLLNWFDTARADLIGTFTGLDPRARLPWYGPAMSAASSLTARIMETWAHGQDIADALGVTREPTEPAASRRAHRRRRARVQLRVRGRTLPQTPVRVELTGPDGDLWTWGPQDAADRVTGPALDFCLLVTQRRHRDDPALVTEARPRPSGCRSPRPSPAPAGPGGRREASGAAARRCLGRYGSRTAPGSTATGWPPPGRCSTGRPDRRADRRLPGRADHADPVEGAAEGPRPRVRHHVPAARWRKSSAPASSVASRSSPTPAASTRRVSPRSSRARRPARPDARVAYVTGDDLIPPLVDLQAAGHELANLDTGLPLAKAGPAGAPPTPTSAAGASPPRCEAGADVVVCPRVTDASLVIGPAAWWHGWRRDDFDALAGAVAAGHVIECGPQATGGNYPFLAEITDRR